MSMSADSGVTSERNAREIGDIFKTPVKKKTDVWSYRDITPQRRLGDLEGSTSCEVSIKKRRKRVSDYCCQPHDQPSTFNTPLKIFDPDKEIADLVDCVKAGSQNIVPKFNFNKTEETNVPHQSKKRRLSMPTQPLNRSNFDPLSLFSETPQESVKKKKCRALRLPRRSLAGKNGIPKGSPLSKMKSPIRNSKISLFQSNAGSPSSKRTSCSPSNRSIKTVESSLRMSNFPYGTQHFSLNGKSKFYKTGNFPTIPSKVGRKKLMAISDHDSVACKDVPASTASVETSCSEPLFSKSECFEFAEDKNKGENGSQSITNGINCEREEEFRSKFMSSLHENIVKIRPSCISNSTNKATTDIQIESSSVISGEKSDVTDVTAMVLVDLNHNSGFGEPPFSEVDIATTENYVLEEKRPGLMLQENEASNFKYASITRDCDLLESENFLEAKSLTSSWEEGDGEDTAQTCQLLPINCELFTTKYNLRTEATLLNELHIGPNWGSNASSEIVDDDEEPTATAYVMVSSPTTDEPIDDIPSPKETVTVRRSSRAKIRRSIPKLEVRHTPMGLPKPIRVKKDKFSVEEIYLNKNFRTPTEKKWETIFEFPKENKDGSVSTYEKRKKRRRCDFMSDPSRRKVKWKKNKSKTNKRKFKAFDGDSDKVLSQKLFNLENALKLADLSP